MRSLSGRFWLCLASSLLLATGVTACSDDDVVDIIDDGHERGNDLGGLADDQLDDASEATRIAAAAEVLLVIDEGVIAQADAAVDRLVDSGNVAFADQLFDDHSIHLALVEATIAADGIVPESTQASAELRSDLDAYTRQLAATTGTTDELYLRFTILTHETALGVLDALDDGIEDDTFEDLLDDTIDMLQDHRDEAVTLYRDL